MKKIILFLASLWLFISCLKPNCEKLISLYQDQECLIILEQKPSNSQVNLDLLGRNILTKKPCRCKDKGRWWEQYSDHMAIGDTLIKRKGELVFYIHKKDTILSFPWQCEGKIYK